MFLKSLHCISRICMQRIVHYRWVSHQQPNVQLSFIVCESYRSRGLSSGNSEVNIYFNWICQEANLWNLYVCEESCEPSHTMYAKGCSMLCSCMLCCNDVLTRIFASTWKRTWTAVLKEIENRVWSNLYFLKWVFQLSNFPQNQVCLKTTRLAYCIWHFNSLKLQILTSKNWFASLTPSQSQFFICPIFVNCSGNVLLKCRGWFQAV